MLTTSAKQANLRQWTCLGFLHLERGKYCIHLLLLFLNILTMSLKLLCVLCCFLANPCSYIRLYMFQYKIFKSFSMGQLVLHWCDIIISFVHTFFSLVTNGYFWFVRWHTHELLQVDCSSCAFRFLVVVQISSYSVQTTLNVRLQDSKTFLSV